MGIEDLLKSYFRSLDAEDWETMRSLWHEDGSMVAVGARPRLGVDAIVEFFSKLFVPWQVHEDKPTRVLICGDTATVEVTFTGTTQDGRQVSFDAVDVIDVEDGRLRRISNWYDIAYARRVLTEEPAGAAP
jgi:uncharacterized protein (TIGR02246 family)